MSQGYFLGRSLISGKSKRFNFYMKTWLTVLTKKFVSRKSSLTKECLWPCCCLSRELCSIVGSWSRNIGWGIWEASVASTLQPWCFHYQKCHWFYLLNTAFKYLYLSPSPCHNPRHGNTGIISHLDHQSPNWSVSIPSGLSPTCPPNCDHFNPL